LGWNLVYDTGILLTLYDFFCSFEFILEVPR
jgi:hypothetical protein